MTDKQKKALKILNELWYVSHNDGLAKLRDDDYYLLVECILNNDYLMDKEQEDYFKKNIVNVPFVRTTPFPECYLPGGVCSNPHRDCINCPRIFDSSYTTTITTTDVKE